MGLYANPARLVPSNHLVLSISFRVDQTEGTSRTLRQCNLDTLNFEVYYDSFTQL
jgi:hypothetical protein